jgi:hypothetical protein
VSDPSIWNVLHDGTIAAIEGEVPGTLRFRIEIWYLRPYFSPAGKAFVVELAECDLFEVLPWSDDSLSRDVAAFAALRPRILSAEEMDDSVKVIWRGGELRLRYSSVHLALDTGEPLTLEALLEAAERYWDALEKRRPPVE